MKISTDIFSSVCTAKAIALGFLLAGSIQGQEFSGINLKELDPSVKAEILKYLPPRDLYHLARFEDMKDVVNNELLQRRTQQIEKLKKWLKDESIQKEIIGGLIIDLSNRGFLFLFPGAFKEGFGEATELLLNNNELKLLEKGTFEGLPELEILNLRENKLKTLKPGVFNGLVNLSKLDLSNNKLSKIDPAVFGDCGIKTEGTLILNGNPLSEEDVINLSTKLPKLTIKFDNQVFQNGEGTTNVVKPVPLKPSFGFKPVVIRPYYRKDK